MTNQQQGAMYFTLAAVLAAVFLVVVWMVGMPTPYVVIAAAFMGFFIGCSVLAWLTIHYWGL